MRPSGLVLVLAVLGVLFATTGCAAGPAPADQPSTSPSRAAAEDDIAEAVFRYAFDHNASSIQKRAEKYCLSLPGGRMPSAGLLRRFEGHRPPVAAADQCERKSGKDLFFRMQKLDWRNDGEVWVRGGYWEANLSSSIELFRVVNEQGKWVVKGARMEAISQFATANLGRIFAYSLAGRAAGRIRARTGEGATPIHLFDPGSFPNPAQLSAGSRLPGRELL